MFSPPADLFLRIERFYDAIPRESARAEQFGPLVLFVRDGQGWPYYARPRLDVDEPPDAAAITRVRQRQRALGVPEAFEWVHEVTPTLLDTARSAGLTVLEAPLMVLDPAGLPPAGAAGSIVRLADPTSDRFARDVILCQAVARIGFGAAGTAVGTAGAPERDAALVEPAPEVIAEDRRLAAGGRRIWALAGTAQDDALACGSLQRHEDVAEITGVATLPSARRRGLGAAVTAALARRALADGVDVVFISASSEEVASVYAGIGFHRVGTACIAEPAAAAPAPGSAT